MKDFKTCISLLLLFVTFIFLGCCQKTTCDSVNQLAEWRKGVWISGSGTYTIYTDSHYFVLSYTGDSTQPNLYYGASQVQFHEKGLARKQVMRLRQSPGGESTLFKESVVQPDHTEAPLEIDTTCFNKNSCTIKDGIIYDVIIEKTDEYILLATCNGDKEKIFADGKSAYLPAGGGEFFSYRVEEF
jgi:hypothetical protein